MRLTNADEQHGGKHAPDDKRMDARRRKSVRFDHKEKQHAHAEVIETAWEPAFIVVKLVAHIHVVKLENRRYVNEGDGSYEESEPPRGEKSPSDTNPGENINFGRDGPDWWIERKRMTLAMEVRKEKDVVPEDRHDFGHRQIRRAYETKIRCLEVALHTAAQSASEKQK